MVGKVFLVGVCLSVGLLASSVVAQIDAGDNTPRVNNPREAMRDGFRRNTAQEKDVRAGEMETVFTTGLADGLMATYEIMSAIEYTEQMGDDESTREVMSENHTMRIRATCRTMRADGTATVFVTFLHVGSRVETSDGPVSVEFDLTRPLPENADELTGFDAMIPALKNAQVNLLVDENGNVVSIEGLPVVADVVTELGLIQPGILGMLEETRFAVLISKLFNAEGGVERPDGRATDAKGVWSTIEEVQLGPSGSLIVTRGWTPKAAEDGSIESRGSFSISVQPPATPNDAAPTCEVAAYNGVGRLLWGVEGGLQYLNSTEALAMQWTFGAETLRTSQESATTITRVER